MNLLEITRQFSNEDECLEHLEKSRWPDGIRCSICGNNAVCKGTRTGSAKNKRTRYYQCLEATCKQQFTATQGTIFHGSHLPLSTWFSAIALLADAKKSISALQIQRHLGIGSYRSAWYMCHRIRKAMEELQPTKMTGTVEMDETYIGGKTKRRKSGQTRSGKFEMVFAMRERDTEERNGRVRYFHIPDGKKDTIKPILEHHIRTDVKEIITDAAVVYDFSLDNRLRSRHKMVNHSTHYVSPQGYHTNTVESAFSLLKRGVVGSFHWISAKHLHRYLSEFEFRFNQRNKDIFGLTMAEMLTTKPLPYKGLVGKG